MGLKIPLRVKVEVEDCIWWFRPPDKAIAKLDTLMRQLPDEYDTEDPPDEIVELTPAIFCEGVIAWEGITDLDDNVLECNEENRRYIPSMVKLSVVNAYLLKLQEIEQKKGE